MFPCPLDWKQDPGSAVLLICECPHWDSHTATGQRPHQRIKGDPTVWRQLFRCGLPHPLLLSHPLLPPYHPAPRPPPCKLPCRSAASPSLHHGLADKQGFCFLFALQLMFLACSTLLLNVLCLLYCRLFVSSSVL